MLPENLPTQMCRANTSASETNRIYTLGREACRSLPRRPPALACYSARMRLSYLTLVDCKASSLSDPEIRTGWTQAGSPRILRRVLSTWARTFLAQLSALVRGPAPASSQLETLPAEREFQLRFVHPLSRPRDFTGSMHPDIQNSGLEKEYAVSLTWGHRVGEKTEDVRE